MRGRELGTFGIGRPRRCLAVEKIDRIVFPDMFDEEIIQVEILQLPEKESEQILYCCHCIVGLKSVQLGFFPFGLSNDSKVFVKHISSFWAACAFLRHVPHLDSDP